MADTKLFAPDGTELNRGHDLPVDNRRKLGQYLSNRTSNVTPDQSSFASTDYQEQVRANDFPIDGTSVEDLNLRRDGNRNYDLPQVPSTQSTFADKQSVDRWSRSNNSDKVGWKSVTVADRAGGEQNKRRVLNQVVGGNPGSETNEYSDKLRTGVSSVLAQNAFTQEKFFTSRPDVSTNGVSSKKSLDDMREAALNALGYAYGLKKSDGPAAQAATQQSNRLNLTPASVKRGVDGLRPFLKNSSENLQKSQAAFDGKSVGGPGEDFSGLPSQYIGASNITPPYPDDGLGNTGGVYTGMTYGSKDSPEIPFGNLIEAASSVLAAIVAAAAIFVAINVWSLVLTLIIYKLDRPDYTTGINPPGAERDTSIASDLISAALGVKRPYSVNTLIAGFEGSISFLGIDGPLGSVVGDAVINFAFSPDYYILICRMVLGGVYSFVGQSGNAGTGPEGAVAALFNLRTNKLVSFVNRMIDIGSISLRGVDTTVDIEAGNDVNYYYENAVRRVSRSRQNGNKLAWRSSSTAMALLTPNVAIRGSAALRGDAQNAGIMWADRIAKRVPLVGNATTTSGSLDSSYSNQIERELNAEYVPFYFKDLRTNEIISFHAFLADLSDSFTVSYTTSDGFGRQDPVQMYKGTTRAIGLSFHVVSTSPKDHDVMWFKINKLISMLYPQYTDGIVVESNKNKFEVPFSQVYGASPVIRLRIGDLISSNYSRFGLAKLFGLGKADRSFTSGDPDSPEVAESISSFDSVMSVKGTQTSADWEKVNDASEQRSSILDPTGLLKPKVSGRVIRGGIFRGSSGMPASVLGFSSRTYSVHIRAGTTFTMAPAGDLTSFPMTDNMLLKSDTGGKRLALVNLDPPIKIAPNRVDANVSIDYAYIPYELIEFTEKVQATIIPVIPPPPAPTSPTVNKLKDFFSPNGIAANSIVRSFESSMGQGLAGVITSLSMDWGEATWETDRPGSKAPIWLKITMNFTPIHDLPMGLDSGGEMLSPAYPVGDVIRGIHGIDTRMKDGSVEQGFTSSEGGQYNSGSPVSKETTTENRVLWFQSNVTKPNISPDENPVARYKKRPF